MSKNLWAVSLLLFCTYQMEAQVRGFVLDGSTTSQEPIEGAVVAATHSGSVTVTDQKGFFELAGLHDDDYHLVVSYVGMSPDTVELKGKGTLKVVLQPRVMNEVVVERRKANRSETSPQNMEIITSNDLVKDACCNLSESFENSATVDVNYSDAVSGAKEIRMLGLDGVYSQIMVENIPSIRGLGNTFGMNYIPGPWMNSIQVNKGAGSVANGYESMTGQINIEYKKPQSAERFYVNYFLNQDVRNELNIYSAYKLNSRLSMLTALHGQLNWLKMDMNHDNFIDNPLVLNLNAIQRVSYISENFNLITAASYTIEDRRGGQMNYRFDQPNHTQADWGVKLLTHRSEVFAKTGFLFRHRNSMGIQYKYIFHDQKGFIGDRNYNAREHFGYFNLLYQQAFDKDEDVIKFGWSFAVNDVKDALDSLQIKRTELIPGMFAEATYNVKKALVVTAGLRADYNTMFGAFLSPRLHAKWNILYQLSLRVSAGRGYRTPIVFAENFGLLASNRSISIPNRLKPEQGWNYGASLNWSFFLDFREGNISFDYYRTDFQNQLVIDIENPRELKFYNLVGRSFANSYQAEASYEVIRNFTVKLAYKFDDARTDFESGLKQLPLKPRHRGLVSLEYKTINKHWRFNTSLNWFGKVRVPSTTENSIENQRSTLSKDYFQLNAQVTYILGRWEVYLGGENLTNFSQPNAIISAENPLSQQFDASLIWGPLRGAMAFAGVRFVLK